MHTSFAPSGPHSRILVVAENELLQHAVRTMLAEESYPCTLVPTLEQALAAVATEPYDLILAQLYVGRHKTALSPAHILRRRVWPTPMGLLITQRRVPAEVELAGFAFVLPMPFNSADLLVYVAGALEHPWTPLRERQAQVVRRFLAALECEEWLSALAVCTDEIRYYPSPTSPVLAARGVEGKDAYLAYLTRASHYYRSMHYGELRLYPTPKGIAAHYLSRWVTPEDTRERQVGTALFHFVGKRISEVGTRWIAHQPASLPQEPGEPSAG